MGRRKSRLDAKFIAEFCEHVKNGQTYKVACALTRISESTFFFFLREAEQLRADLDNERIGAPRDRRSKNLLKFLESLRVAEAKAEERAVKLIQIAAIGTPMRPGDPRWAAFWLERRRRKDWGRHGQSAAAGDSSNVLSPAEEVRRMLQSVTGTPEQIAELYRDDPPTQAPPNAANTAGE